MTCTVLGAIDHLSTAGFTVLTGFDRTHILKFQCQLLRLILDEGATVTLPRREIACRTLS